MSTYNCSTDILKIKYPNLKFNKTYTICINDIDTICIDAILLNRPERCPHCGNDHINIHGYKESMIKLMPILGYNAVMKLNKQRYRCKSCGKTFTAQTDIVRKTALFLMM